MNKKRFIAGAVCPRCAQMDKLVMFRNEEGQQLRECVACGYSDRMTESGPEELVTRVNQARLDEEPLMHEDEVKVVKLMDMDPSSKP